MNEKSKPEVKEQEKVEEKTEEKPAEEKTEEKAIEEVEEIKPVKKQKKRKPETHVSDEKKELVRELGNLMNKKTVMIVSINDLPSSQFQEIRKKLRGRAEVRVTKKSLIDFALEHAKNEHLEELEKYVNDNTAIIFSDEDAFELSAFLSESKSLAKAKVGQVALEDIKIEAGPTDLLPGPDISALSAVGLKPKVENGKLSIQESVILVKKGEEISEAKASVLAKLDITPFEIGVSPVAAFYEGNVYEDIKIDKKATLEELENLFGRGLAFAVSLNYLTKETIPYILGKAVAHENALKSLIKEEVVEEKKVESPEVKEEPSTEEGKVEEKKASEASPEKPVEESEENKSETQTK